MVATTDTNPHTFTTGSGLSINSAAMLNAAKQAAVVQILNRTGNSDGVIQEYKKDGSTVGSIGSRSGAGIYLDSGSGADGLLKSGGTEAFGWSTQYLYPRTDNARDLGISYLRFKDLYLSGGVYLGGTGSANLLDSYEEGTWTPVFNNFSATGTTTNAGSYVKVGNLVYVELNLDLSSPSYT